MTALVGIALALIVALLLDIDWQLRTIRDQLAAPARAAELKLARLHDLEARHADAMAAYERDSNPSNEAPDKLPASEWAAEVDELRRKMDRVL